MSRIGPVTRILFIGLTLAVSGLAGCDSGDDVTNDEAKDEASDETLPDIEEVEITDPLSGATVADPVAADPTAGCDGIRGAVGADFVPACEVIDAPGGRFAVVQMVLEGESQVAVFTPSEDAEGRPEWNAFLNSDPVTVGPPSDTAVPDYANVVIRTFDLDGFPLAVVAWEQAAAGGSPREFNVLGWFEDELGPENRHYEAERDALLWVEGDTVIVTHPSFDDGSPACCPTQGTVRRDRWPGPFEQDDEVEVVPYDDLPQPPSDAIGVGDVSTTESLSP